MNRENEASVLCASKANTCTCTGGTAATGSACTTDSAVICTNCNSGYHSNGNNACEALAESDTGEAKEEHVSSYQMLILSQWQGPVESVKLKMSRRFLGTAVCQLPGVSIEWFLGETTS